MQLAGGSRFLSNLTSLGPDNDLDVGIVQYLFTKVPERGGRHALQGAATSD
jgi:hypothetical protein